jgi:hypothetical protein
MWVDEHLYVHVTLGPNVPRKVERAWITAADAPACSGGVASSWMRQADDRLVVSFARPALEQQGVFHGPTALDVQLGSAQAGVVCERVAIVESGERVAWRARTRWSLGGAFRVLVPVRALEPVEVGEVFTVRGGRWLGTGRVQLEGMVGFVAGHEREVDFYQWLHGGSVSADHLVMRRGRLGLGVEVAYEAVRVQQVQPAQPAQPASKSATGDLGFFHGPRVALQLRWLYAPPLPWRVFAARHDDWSASLDLFAARWYDVDAQDPVFVGFAMSGDLGF